MVKGKAALHQRIQKIPRRIEAAAKEKIASEADRVVAHMRNLNDLPAIEIDWTWGKAPSGSITLAATKADGIRATIYATAKTSDYPGGFGAIARWWEFGTADRRHRKTGKSTGRIPASPYFYPAWRANRTRTRSAIKRAITKAWKAS